MAAYACVRRQQVSPWRGPGAYSPAALPEISAASRSDGEAGWRLADCEAPCRWTSHVAAVRLNENRCDSRDLGGRQEAAHSELASISRAWQATSSWTCVSSQR